MPANPKYLTTSASHRFAKLIAAIPGSFLLSVSLHFAVASWLNDAHKLWSVYS